MRLFLALWVLLLVPMSFGATLHGSIYNLDLDLVNNVVVEVDSTPVQRFVAKDGTYRFELPPGNYTITSRLGSGVTDNVAEESIVIATAGDFVVDLFLFPEIELEDELDDEIAPPPIEEEDIDTSQPLWYYILLAVWIIILAIIVYVFYKNSRKEKKRVVHVDFADEVVDFIKKQGGRTTQKDLRKHFPLSEAKISLVVTELVSKGVVQKIKKGRSNVLTLKNK